MKTLFAWLLLLLAPTLLSAQTLTLEGQSAFQTTGNTVVITVDRIRFSCPAGVSGTSGSIRLELWATSSPFSGTGSISGYRTAIYQLPQVLSCGQSYTNVSSGTVAYTPPPAGYASYSLLLSEFDSGGWFWVDYVNFPGSGSNNGGLVNVSCTDNVVTMKFWDHATQDNDIVTVRLNGQALVTNFDMNQCGGPNEPGAGPCVFTRTLPANSAIPLEITAINEGSISPNTAALKVIGGCTPERQEWGLSAGSTGRININTGQGGGTTSYALQVSRAGTGSGSVSSSPTGISCGSTCSANFSPGTSVTLSASASSGSVFAGWSGDCSGAQSSCTVSMNLARSVSATFNSSSPGGGGITTLQNGGSVNGSTNSSAQNGDFREYVVTIPSGTTQLSVNTSNHTGDVDLYVRFASAPTLSTYDCRSIAAGNSPDSCTIPAPVSGTWYIRVYGYQIGSVSYLINASWTGGSTNQTLSVSRSGNGSGTVTSSPAGVSCGSTCSASFASGAAVTLTATAASGSVFAGWSGDCTGSQSSCNLSMGQGRNVTAAFSATGGGTPRDEPTMTGFALPTPNPAFPNCPGGYFIATVDDGPGAGLTPGIFGMELLLNSPGTLRMEGGLNFGALLDGSQVAFAGFNVQNPANEQQRLDIRLRGNPRQSQSGSLQVRVKVIRQPAPNVNEVLLDTVGTLTLAAEFVRSLTINPGYHVVTIGPEGSASIPGGSADGEVFVELASQFTNRPGGGFFGGVVIGGYHASHPNSGVSGFAAFCIASSHTSNIRVLSAPTYGVTGARDLRLKILDYLRRDVLVVP